MTSGQIMCQPALSSDGPSPPQGSVVSNSTGARSRRSGGAGCPGFGDACNRAVVRPGVSDQTPVYQAVGDTSKQHCGKPWAADQATCHSVNSLAG